MAVQGSSRWEYLKSPEVWFFTAAAFGAVYWARQIWKEWPPIEPLPSPLDLRIQAKIEQIELYCTNRLLPENLQVWITQQGIEADPELWASLSETILETHREIGADCLLWDAQKWREFSEWVCDEPCHLLHQNLEELGDQAAKFLELGPLPDDYLELLHTWEK